MEGKILMNRYLCWLGIILLSIGCGKQEPKTDKVCIDPNKVAVDHALVQAMLFCEARGKSLKAYESHDYSKIGMDYKYEITCIDK
jgi:hypothetical protein